jgi:pyruvate-formate lyase-activating enzyme
VRLVAAPIRTLPIVSMRAFWQRRAALPLIARALWAKRPCPPEFEGARPTVRRWANYARLLWAWHHGDTVLPFPARLCIEASSACNLRCPYCFTGAGEQSRERATLSPAFFDRLLDELADYLWQVEFHNWGEPLLNKHLFAMIAAARARGLSTMFNTNFSLPFDVARAEALVRSGIAMLGVSIDGATQSSYEQYRVGGRLDLVRRNCELVTEAKRWLGSRTPRMIWTFHLFAHNLDDVNAAAAQAAALGMDFSVARGRVVGADWDPDEHHIPHEHVTPIPCPTLFHTAVVYGDGSVAPCRGSFYAPDDMGRIAVDDRAVASTLRAVWNGERFRLARRFFGDDDATRSVAGPAEQEAICFNCPHLLDVRDFRRFRMAGGNADAWVPQHDSNARYNYFWRRKQHHEGGAPTTGSTKDAAATSASRRAPS